MKLYQAGYFRLGGRGSGAGWKLVAPSAGMSEIAKAGFRGIASRLADLRQTVQVPQTAMGLFRHERFVYLMHVNYAAAGEDSRGVAYVHGYCFNLAEYYQMAVQPQLLFGVPQQEFDMEYQPQLSAYPVREALDYRNLNERRLLDQYHLSAEQYKKLILGAICALEGYTGPMCIRCGVRQEQGIQTWQELMYLIMKGLPYHLRQKLLSFSCQGMKTAVYCSDQVQGENYADLDTGNFSCDYSRLAGYHFTKLYQMELFYSSRDSREQIFQNMAGFIGEVWTDPLKEAGCAMIEAAFQNIVKKNDDGIDPQQAAGLLQDFLGSEISYGSRTAEYVAALLDAINEGGIPLTDPKLSAAVRQAYGKCPHDLLLEPVALWYARSIRDQYAGSRNKDAGFAVLIGLRESGGSDLYPAVCRCLERLDPDYFSDYFWNCFLPGELTTLKKAERFFKKNGQTFTAKEHQQFQKLLKELTEREMKEAGSFEELCIAAQVTDRIRCSLAAPDRYQQLWKEVCRMLWDHFTMDWFETDSIRAYRQYEVQKTACPNAKKVSRLAELAESAADCMDACRLWEMLNTGQTSEDRKYGRMIRRGLREAFFAGAPVMNTDSLDRSLVFFYDPEKKQFDLVKWITWWKKQTDLAQASADFAVFGTESALLADGDRRACVRQYLKQTAYNHLQPDVRQALRCLSDSLNDSRTGGAGTGYLLADYLHREILSLFVLLTLAVCGICLRRYGSGDIVISMVFVVFTAVGLAVSAALRMMTGVGSSQSHMADADVIRRRIGTVGAESEGGREKVLSGCLSAVVLAAFTAAAVLAYRYGGFTEKAVCLMVFLALTAGMVLVSGLLMRE